MRSYDDSLVKLGGVRGSGCITFNDRTLQALRVTSRHGVYANYKLLLKQWDTNLAVNELDALTRQARAKQAEGR